MNNHLPINDILKICTEHAELIKSEIKARETEAIQSKGWLSFDKITDICGYRGGKQYFAIEGGTATGLMVIDDDNIFVVPAICDGAVYSSYPDEGSGGIAHLLLLKKRENGQAVNRWSVVWMSGGWLHKEEFEKLSPAEIGDVLVDEILDGKNVIIPKPQGRA